jgi:hypothetical protein
MLHFHGKLSEYIFNKSIGWTEKGCVLGHGLPFAHNQAQDDFDRRQ